MGKGVAGRAAPVRTARKVALRERVILGQPAADAKAGVGLVPLLVPVGRVRGAGLGRRVDMVRFSRSTFLDCVR